MVTHEKREVFIQRSSKLFARENGSFKIIENIGRSAYKLKFPDDYDISPIFNVKDLRPYHGEDLRASLFAQLWVIDEGATTTCIWNLALIMEKSDSRGCEI